MMKKIKALKMNQLFQDNYFQCLINKWGITAEELNEAILETGSLEEVCIKTYLLQKGVLISVFGVFYYSINIVKGYFKLKFNKKKNMNQGFSLSRASYMTICSN